MGSTRVTRPGDRNDDAKGRNFHASQWTGVQEHIRKDVEQVIAPPPGKKVGQAIRPGQAGQIAGHLLHAKIGLVGKDAGHGFSKLGPDRAAIRLIGNVRKSGHSLGVEVVRWRVIVKPLARRGDHPAQNEQSLALRRN